MSKQCKACGGEVYEFQHSDLCYACERDAYREITSSEIRLGREVKTSYELDIFCPWCGEVYEIDDEYELYGDGDHEVTCCDCEKTFVVETSVSHYFSTARKEVDDGQG